MTNLTLMGLFANIYSLEDGFAFRERIKSWKETKDLKRTHWNYVIVPIVKACINGKKPSSYAHDVTCKDGS